MAFEFLFTFNQINLKTPIFRKQMFDIICFVARVEMEIDYRKIIFKRNVFKDIAEYVKNKERVLVVSSCEASKKYLQTLINFFNEKNIDFSVLYLSHNATACEEEIEKVCEKAKRNYSLLLSFGANTVSDIVKLVSLRLSIDYIVVPTTISHFGFFSDSAYKFQSNTFEKFVCPSVSCIFIDEEIIKNSNSNFIFSTFSFILSFTEHIVNLKILEEIYNVSYKEQIDQIQSIIIKTEGLFNWLSLGNKEAVLTLMEYVVELYSIVCKIENVVNNSVEISLLSRKITSSKNFGRRCLFYSEVLLNVYKKFFSQKNISIIDIPNFKNLEEFVEKNHFFSKILPKYLNYSEKFLKTELFFKLRIVKSELFKFCDKKLSFVKKASKKITSVSENFGVTKYIDENKFFGAISSFPVLNFDTKFLGIMLRLGYLNF